MLKGLFIIATLVVFAASSPVELRDDRGARIVGGFNAGPSQFPHQASLRTPLNSHFCGASIIHNRWLLTGKHLWLHSSPYA